MEGVVLRPSEFSITLEVLPSITATQELVVPRSIPMTLPILINPLFSAGRPGPYGTRRKRPAGIAPALDRPWSDPSSSPAGPRRGSQRHIGGRHRAARQEWWKWLALTSRLPAFSVRGAKLVAVLTWSWPGLSRPSR